MIVRKDMSWRRVANSLQAFSAHTALFCFTSLLVLKLDHLVPYSWWVIFFPLFLFHAIVARGRFSLPAPSVPHGRDWAPCHAVVATPLLIAFELLLCVFLESYHADRPAAVRLQTVFLPLLAFEVAILVDNFRMCKALLPGDDESVSDDAIWETLPHFWVAISMVFFIAATVFTLLKLSGFVDALGWWDLLINFGIAECFSFLVCTKWSNPVIHRNLRTSEASSSSTAIRYLDWNSGLVVSSEDTSEDGMCNLQDIGGHIMKIPIIVFQILLCMHLEGKPVAARSLSIPVIFSPLFLLQGVGLLLSASRLVEKIIILLHEGSREEQARLYHDGASGYNTFCGYPPEIVKKMPKKDLAEEVWRLQAALGEQTEITKFSQQEYERLQNEKVLCRVCFEGEISTVLLPCRHRILCSTCCEKCKKCPICRVNIEERLPVYDV
ncbi:Transmembrane Fragile-X-F-associated protein [Cynara cardunculus var. scolymus]|uniref:Transmembrane Fragile-X-F-associated protein n=1 Tax=Cynara cardunculus var. scolymus TaxID=59895 RepID=A0A118K1B4_CYNCS|nr:Transmembrane Fragile-X-F-associated protein [Cynara cardunculus var. scolymus]